MSKFKHTVEIETDSEADATVRVILKHSQSGVSAKIIKTEEIKPPVLPLKVGDRLRRVATGEYGTVVYIGRKEYALEWDSGYIAVWSEPYITRLLERVS